MNPTTALSIVFAACASLLTSCASGPDHADVKNSTALTPHAGKSMVIVYRTSGLAGRGSKPFIWVNNTQMPGTLARGGYYSYETAPGPVKVEFAWHDHPTTAGETVGNLLTGGPVLAIIEKTMGHDKEGLDITAVANHTHYVLMDGRQLSESTKEDADEALVDCQWLNSPSAAKR